MIQATLRAVRKQDDVFLFARTISTPNRIVNNNSWPLNSSENDVFESQDAREFDWLVYKLFIIKFIEMIAIASGMCQ